MSFSFLNQSFLILYNIQIITYKTSIYLNYKNIYNLLNKYLVIAMSGAFQYDPLQVYTKLI